MAHYSASRNKKIVSPMMSMLMLLMLLLLSACNGDTQLQQTSQKNKSDLDRAIAQAQSIGVPDSLLQPIIDQENKLSQTGTPLNPFSDQPANDYYNNLTQRYQMLTLQVNGLQTQSTQQLDYQAFQDLQVFESVLAQRQSQGFIEAKTFADQLTQDQTLMNQAKYPKHYLQVSENAKKSTQALRLMGPAYDKLTTLRTTITQMQSSRLDVTVLQQQEQDDLTRFRKASSPDDFTRVIDMINTQLSETTTMSAQAIPFVGAAKLKELSNDIDQMKQYGGDVTKFQQSLEADQKALKNAKSVGDFMKVSQQIDTDTAAIQLPLLQSQAKHLLNQFHQEVENWGASHQYKDDFDGKSYKLDYEYDVEHGFGGNLDDAFNTAQSADDYQGVIDQVNDNMVLLKAMEADYSDTTSWDKPHATDMQLMQHFKATGGQVLVVSLIEQSLRVYQDGKLVNAFQVTTGQYNKPSPPGFWHIFDRESPTTFKSGEPKGSAFWYPDTHINYAMEYRGDGYYFHDSWWRLKYGPGTNFPHFDGAGDEQFSGDGSHGCVNLQQDQAGWLYQNTTFGTSVILY